MLQDASQIVKPRGETGNNEMEEAIRRGRAALKSNEAKCRGRGKS